MKKTKANLLAECDAYERHAQKMNTARVRQLIKEAFRIGYEQAIENYCIEPYGREDDGARTKD